jgi:hypothetical protein
MNFYKTRSLFIAPVIIIAVAIAWAIPAIGAYPQTITTNTPFVNLPRPSGDPRWAGAFSHWDKRDDTDEIMEAIGLFEALAKDNPDKMEPQMWLCRTYFVAALRKRSQRVEFAKISAAAGDKALAISPGNDNVLYWHASAIMLHRDFTEAESKEVREFGARYRHVPILPGFNDPLFKEAAVLWNKREERDKVEALIDLLKKIESDAPKRIEPKIWLCAANYKMMFFEDDKEKRANWVKTGMDYGRAAMEIEPRNPAANYFTCCCLGEIGNNTNILNYARYGLDIGRELQVIVEEDPQYYFGGFSRYFAAAIGVAGSVVAKVAELLGFPEELIYRATSFSINFEPDYFSNHHDFALMLLALDKKDEAKNELLFILNGDPTSLPGYETENRQSQKDAQILYDENFSAK